MKENILIVDDEEGVRESLNLILSGKYNTHIYSEGTGALKAAGSGIMDIAFLDIRMPHMGGIELLKRLKASDPYIQVAIITGYGSLDTAVDALRLGAYDYINKPFSRAEVEELVQKGIRLRKQRMDEKNGLKKIELIYSEVNQRLDKVYSKTVESLLAAVNAKDSYTSSHSEEVARYAMKILEHMNLKMTPGDKEIFRYVCALHDIGKIGVSEMILRKDSKLTGVEMDEIKKHPKIGTDILKPVEFLKDYFPIILYHHEKYDGCGYPSGKKGKDLPIHARILAVADSYHAMRSDRPYRKALSKLKAREELLRCSGSQFDPDVVESALSVLA
jgi:putative two-component system response regulator